MSGKSYRRDRNEKKKSSSEKSEEKEHEQSSVAESGKTSSEDAKKVGDDTKMVSDGTEKISEDVKKSNEPQEMKESSAVQEDTVGEDSGGGGGDVINIEQMEIEKERQVIYKGVPNMILVKVICFANVRK